MRLEETHTKEIDQWIKERHYLQSVPAISTLRLWVLDDEGNRIGGMLWGHPTARKLDQTNILELLRMFFIDETDPFVESKSLAMARKHIRKHLPKIKGVLAYSSTGQGHEGIIYQADNWFQMGINKTAPWSKESRKGRIDRDLSPKIRWVRSV